MRKQARAAFRKSQEGGGGPIDLRCRITKTIIILNNRRIASMDLVDLQVFKCVVDEGGIIKAARELHRVPSSVTMRVKQLETSLGVTLFHRDRQRLHLSPTGELLLAYAERLIQLSDEARAVVSGGIPQGTLKLGALESTTASRLPRILTDFHRRYPQVRLELI